jgi:asparaginyl-tRNA synthetase
MSTRVSQILAGAVSVGSKVTVEGWIRTRRDSKAGLSFLAIHDGSCHDPIQVVASQGKGQSVEIRADSVEVVGWVDDPDHYPMQPKRHTMEYLREVAHLRPRTNIIGAVTRVRHTLAQAVHRFFHENGFFWIHTPVITASDAEGAGQMFRVSTLDAANPPRLSDGKVDWDKDFFGKEARLTVSGQLNVETYCLALSKVYTFGPTFRAENSNTRRHLSEFWMIEPEIAFADLAADAQLAEDFLKYIFRALLAERADDMAFFEKFVDKECIARLNKMIDTKFARLDYGDAIKELDRAQKAGEKFEFEVKWGIDLQSEHEKFLTDKVINGPVAVINYPKDIKAFYMRMNDDGKTVAAMDVLAPGIGEIIGGSQREERLEMLDARIEQMGLHAKDYWWYRDLRRYGTVPHAGFGLGFERAIIYATGVENIRDVIPFPRAPRQAEF